MAVICAACFAAAIVGFQQPARKPSRSGVIQDMKVGSKILNRERNVSVWLPPDYEKDTKRKYPVLYMHDGQNIFDGMTSYIPNAEWRVDEIAGALITAKLVEPIIIVGIDNAGMDRANEYLPTRATMGGGENKQTFGGGADDYGKFLTDELMPIIKSKYRVDPRPEKTGLCGSSFGGIVTLHLGLTRPDAFRRLGVVSPSLWWDNRVMLKRVEEHGDFKGQKLWFDIGGLEGPRPYDDCRKLAEILRTKKLKEGRDWVYVEEANSEHNEPSWARRMGSILMFLYPAKR